MSLLLDSSFNKQAKVTHGPVDLSPCQRSQVLKAKMMALRALFAKSFRLVPGIHLQAAMMKSRNTCKPNILALHGSVLEQIKL